MDKERALPDGAPVFYSLRGLMDKEDGLVRSGGGEKPAVLDKS